MLTKLAFQTLRITAKPTAQRATLASRRLSTHTDINKMEKKLPSLPNSVADALTFKGLTTNQGDKLIENVIGVIPYPISFFEMTINQTPPCFWQNKTLERSPGLTTILNNQGIRTHANPKSIQQAQIFLKPQNFGGLGGNGNQLNIRFEISVKF